MPPFSQSSIKVQHNKRARRPTFVLAVFARVAFASFVFTIFTIVVFAAFTTFAISMADAHATEKAPPTRAPASMKIKRGQASPLCRITYSRELPIYGKDSNSRHQDMLLARELGDKDHKTKPIGYLTENEFFACHRNQYNGAEYALPQFEKTPTELPPHAKDMPNLQETLRHRPAFVEVSLVDEKNCADASQTGEAYCQANLRGQKSIEVFLEDIPHRHLQVFKTPGSNYKDVKENPDERAALINLDKNQHNLYFIQDAKWVPDYYDPVSHQKVGRMFYKVDVVEVDHPKNKEKIKAQYLKGEGVTGTEGWVDSQFIRLSPIVKTPTKDDATEAGVVTADCTTCDDGRRPMDETKKQVETLKIQTETKSQAEQQKPPSGGLPSQNYEDIAKIFFDKTQSCLKKGLGELKKETPSKSNLVGAYVKFAEKKLKSQKIESKGVTTEQALAIDALARTIYGEMRSCHNNIGSRYSKAQARIVLNRAEHCRVKSCTVAPGAVGKSLPQAIIEVLKKPSQFHVWNINDPNADEIMCIPSNSIEQRVWRETVAIATEAVLNTERFKSKTKSVGARTFHYVSAGEGYVEKPWLAGLPRKSNIVIDGLPVDRASCLRAHETPPNKNVFLQPDSAPDLQPQLRPYPYPRDKRYWASVW